MSKYLLLLLLLGCEAPEHPGWPGAHCRPDYTCDPGLQCQVTTHFHVCVPIGVTREVR
jgi:hypothetical protein